MVTDQPCANDPDQDTRDPAPARIILFHKQATSGRVRFFCLHDSIIAFDTLPILAALRDEDACTKVSPHPTAYLRDAEQRLGLAPESTEAEAEFHALVDTPAGDIAIILAGFRSIDPPFAAAESLGARFIALTDARNLPTIERDLLRRAYEHLLG